MPLQAITSGLTIPFRIPMIVGLNATSLFFIISLASIASYREVMGGVLLGGALVVLVSAQPRLHAKTQPICSSSVSSRK